MMTTKDTIKKYLQFVSIIFTSPLLLFFFLISRIIEKDSLFSSISQGLSLIPGKPGSYIRIGFYRFTMTQCHPNCTINFGTLFSQTDTEIHEGVYIGPQCNIGKSRIGKNCLIGSGVHIMSGKGQHNYHNLKIPIKEQGGSFEKISIGEDSWIGNSALIMANVGKKCIIGAGSVVTHPIEDCSIVVGNPAKLIRKRT